MINYFQYEEDFDENFEFKNQKKHKKLKQKSFKCDQLNELKQIHKKKTKALKKSIKAKQSFEDKDE